MVIIGLCVTSCKKEEDNPFNFDGTYNGFIHYASTDSSREVQIVGSKSTSKTIEVKGISGTKIGFRAEKTSEVGECLYYVIIPNDSIQGVQVCPTCTRNYHFTISKDCKCILFKIVTRGDTLTFTTR